MTDVIVWLVLVALLQASLAVQVRFTFCTSGQVTARNSCVAVTVTGPPQASANTGVVNVIGFGHTTVPLEPEETNAGGVVSCTVTVWLHCTELPHSSVAVQVRL